MRHIDRYTLSDYIADLYFGMLSLNPQSPLLEFIKQHIPSILSTQETAGAWTAYPPDVVKEPKYITATHSYHFSSHPYFAGKFENGQLAITVKAYQNDKRIDNITALKLWFDCADETDAKQTFDQLIESFSKFNTLKRRTAVFGLDIFEVTDSQGKGQFNNIQVVLAIDYSISKRYLVPTETDTTFAYHPGYRILVELGNDLY